jgi:hypothetical protein
MQSMFLGFVAAAAIAIGAHFALGTTQMSATERYAAPISVRL